MTINLDIDVLRTLATAMTVGGFAQAAEILGRTPSALSLQMRKLESHFDQPLFHKQGRRLVPTEAGETVLRYARRILALNDELVTALARTELGGGVRLGIPQDYAETRLPALLGRFVQFHPAVQIDVTVERSSTLVDAIARATLDLALIHHRHSPVDDKVTGTRLWRLPVEWIVSPGFRYSGSQPLPLALLNPPCPFRDMALSALESINQPCRIAFSSGSPAGLWAATAAGLGVTARPMEAAPAGLIAAPPTWNLPPLGDIALWLIRPHDRLPNQAVERLAAVIGEMMTTQGMGVTTISAG